MVADGNDQQTESVEGNRLATSIGSLRLSNPVLVASGTFGYAVELSEFVQLQRLGGIVTKTVTLKPRPGNPPPRIVETPAGMLNAIGLQNIGVDQFVNNKLPLLAEIGTAIFVSIMGYTSDEFAAVVEIINGQPGIDGLELNLSCPNVEYHDSKGARMVAHDPELTYEVVHAVNRATNLPIIAKLSPDVPDITVIGQAAEAAGADALTVMNTIPGMVIDLDKRSPVLDSISGGLSGPAIRPLAVRLTYELVGAINIPVIGVGGIVDYRDALQFLFAGASAIQVGTATFTNPSSGLDIIDGLMSYLEKNGDERITDVIGAAQRDQRK